MFENSFQACSRNKGKNMDIIRALQEELGIGRGQVEAAVKLIDEGNTIPFIARYRKEATGSLNDEVLRNLDERLRYLRNLEEMCIRDSIGTERHESRRIDNQLRGRSGRQGDPGESRFYISLEDDLMRLFGSERLMSMFNACLLYTSRCV